MKDITVRMTTKYTSESKPIVTLEQQKEINVILEKIRHETARESIAMYAKLSGIAFTK